MEYLTVYKPAQEKVRIGSKGDGGYVIVNGLTYDHLIGCGISDDVNFEIEFMKKYNVSCSAFDGTVNGLPENAKTSGINFIKKNIGPTNTPTTTNLHEEIKPYNDIFFKMDIESYEFRWLQTMSSEQLNKFKQIVIEFHYPFDLYPSYIKHFDTQLPVVEKMAVFKKLAETHVLVHFHGNNCCGTTVHEGIITPNIFECTYIRKDVHTDSGLNTTSIPSTLDAPNTGNPEIHLNWPPFVHTV